MFVNPISNQDFKNYQMKLKIAKAKVKNSAVSALGVGAVSAGAVMGYKKVLTSEKGTQVLTQLFDKTVGKVLKNNTFSTKGKIGAVIAGISAIAIGLIKKKEYYNRGRYDQMSKQIGSLRSSNGGSN